MHKSTRTGLIAIAILVCVIVVILLLNLDSIKPSHDALCVKLDGGKTCHSVDTNPYRYYGTKTAYYVALGDILNYKFDVGECKPKTFYLLSRHATRYPDKDNIVEINSILPTLRDRIINSSLSGKVEICAEDLKKLKNWTSEMEPENDNKITDTGEEEAEELAQRLKRRFLAVLNETYSPEKFVIEYTSRERTRSTAEAFAKGLFNEDYKNIDFDGKTNDKVLQFHKDCKKLQKSCKDASYDISEVEKFENGSMMQKVIDSVSKRVGFNVSKEDITVMYRACVFGYALNISDIWCALFSTDELKILEYGDDLDDYYKDAYGNEINHQQACPAVEYIVNLLKTSENSTSSKAVLHFTHAGGIKKVYSAFGLFHDEKPLTASGYCTQSNRKWQSSKIAPFNTNIVFILYQCTNDLKVVAFHNERMVKLGGCSDTLCPLHDFYEHYEPIAENCDINKICCTCCKY
ncbi:Multiple inositol polyphosphate phosphatase 1, partial [Stegodyphus mimosarum]